MGQEKCKAGATHDRTAIGIPKIPSPAPIHRKNLIFMENEHNRTATIGLRSATGM